MTCRTGRYMPSLPAGAAQGGDGGRVAVGGQYPEPRPQRGAQLILTRASTLCLSACVCEGCPVEGLAEALHRLAEECGIRPRNQPRLRFVCGGCLRVGDGEVLQP
jgi:hypothetical protein